ncbi:MAG: hypothetical protein AAGM22_13480 [Acidobacteriota bacterium]
MSSFLRTLSSPSTASLLVALFLTVGCASTAPESPAPAAPVEPAGSPEAPGAPASPASPEAADDPAEPEEDLSNKIRWTTASEVENFGFDVYRSESEDGPFDLLTEQPLEGGGTVDEPRNYEFVDDTIDPTKAYYYYVESISMDGVRERFTPVVKAKAKRPVD